MKTVIKATARREQWSVLVERLVCAEFALMDACQDAAASAMGELCARLAELVRRCQAHLFDLEALRRQWSARPIGYSRCVRRALGRGRRSVSNMLAVVLDSYRQALAWPLPERARVLVAACHQEHGELAAAGDQLLAALP